MQFLVQLLVCLGLLLSAGCNVTEQPFTYNDQKEISGRAGLFTGRTGSIVLFQEKGSPLFNKD